MVVHHNTSQNWRGLRGWAGVLCALLLASNLAAAQDAPTSGAPLPVLKPAGDNFFYRELGVTPGPTEAAQRHVETPVSVSAPEATPRAEPVRAPESVFRHLPNNIQGYRLIGEIGASEWPMFLTEAQSRASLRFRVGYLASVSVMPEASNLTVSINDKVVGRTRILAPNGLRTAEFEIPAGLLRYGFNAVKIAVEQRHRVDCSLPATYELWTQIDPSQTGLILPVGDQGVSDLTDLAALPADAQGALPIRAVIPRKTSLPNIENIIRAAQMIALIGRFEQPVVEFGPLADGPNGINLVIGTSDELAGLTELKLMAGSGPRVVVQRATTSLRTTVVITGQNTEEVAQALQRFVLAKEQRGSPQGLRAASVFPGFHVEGGVRIRLRDLGVTSEEFSGRFYRTAVNLLMPPDFYPADYSKILIALDGGYASGLLPQSEIMITVNERNAASLNLPRTAGDVFQRNEIPLPLGLLRPGLNRIEIQAQVPMSADRKCDPLAALEGKKRFLLLDTSEIILPPIARIARMPNLAVTATGAFPFSDSEARPKLYVPAPDRDTMNAAATLAARLAVSAGRPINFQVTLTAPPVGSGPTLVVASLRSMSNEVASMAGLDIDAVRSAWQARMEAPPRKDAARSPVEIATRQRAILQRNFPAACGMSNRGLALPVRASADAGPEALRGPVEPARRRNADGDRSLLDEWRDDVRGQARLMQMFWNASDAVSDWADSIVTGASRSAKLWFSAPELAPAVSARSSLIVAQSTFGGSTNDVWTFVTAPTSELLNEAVICLIDPRVWRQIDGRVSFLDASEGQVSNIAATSQRFINTQPPSVGNMRLILASWLSLNQFFYVLIALMLALMLSGSTKWLLRNLGRKA
jgi:hypothetical protein